MGYFKKMNCGHCHTCGSELREVLDGEEWCQKCRTYRRYKSHGWRPSISDDFITCEEAMEQLS